MTSRRFKSYLDKPVRAYRETEPTLISNIELHEIVDTPTLSNQQKLVYYQRALEFLPCEDPGLSYRMEDWQDDCNVEWKTNAGRLNVLYLDCTEFRNLADMSWPEITLVFRIHIRKYIHELIMNL